MLPALIALGARADAVEAPLCAEPFAPADALTTSALGGWDGPWHGGGRGYRLADESLGYAKLRSSGGRALGGHAFASIERRFDCARDGVFRPWLRQGGLGAAGTTLWMSALMRRDGSCPLGPVLELMHGAGGPQGIVVACLPACVGERWALLCGDGEALATATTAAHATALLVLRMDFGATTTASLWVDPALGDAAPARPSARASSRRALALRGVRWWAGLSAGDASLDEVRVGASWASVTPQVVLPPVNQPPSFAIGAAQSVLDDAGHVSVPGWITAISPGPASESAQRVSFSVAVDHPELFAEQPSVGGDGTLAFAPKPGGEGMATLSVTARDDAGASSQPQSATIAIAPSAPVVAEDARAAVSADGTSVSLSVLGASTRGEATLAYHWEALAAPAPVSFSGNDDNAAKSVTVSLAAVGNYAFRAVITDAGGRTVASEVAAAVPALPSVVTISPQRTKIAVGSTQRFSATVADQFGGAMAPLQRVTWTADGGGAIDADGVYAAATRGGPFTITAWVGHASASALVTNHRLVDVAIHRDATQSSNFPWVDGGAYKAVDGNTDGEFSHGSVTHSDLQLQPWWQVDLGQAQDVVEVRLWNRSDTAAERLSNYWLIASDQRIVAADPRAAASAPGASGVFQSAQAGYPTVIPLGRSALQVRVQLDGTDYLSLAEVEVMALENLEPSVRIVSPDDGSMLPLPGPLALDVAAVDPDGLVGAVMLFEDGVQVQTLRSPPWSFALDQVDAGTHTFVARAVDDRGLGADSAPISVTVGTGAIGALFGQPGWLARR